MPLVQRFAQVFGIIYLLVGVLGFIPVSPFLVETVPPEFWGPFSGFLLGLFAVNWLHNLAHLLIGVAGLAVYRSFLASKVYALVIGMAYAALFLLGILTGEGMAPLLGGLLSPLNAPDDVLHLLTALVAFGAYFVSARTPETRRAA